MATQSIAQPITQLIAMRLLARPRNCCYQGGAKRAPAYARCTHGGGSATHDCVNCCGDRVRHGALSAPCGEGEARSGRGWDEWQGLEERGRVHRGLARSWNDRARRWRAPSSGRPRKRTLGREYRRPEATCAVRVPEGVWAGAKRPGRWDGDVERSHGARTTWVQWRRRGTGNLRRMRWSLHILPHTGLALSWAVLMMSIWAIGDGRRESATGPRQRRYAAAAVRRSVSTLDIRSTWRTLPPSSPPWRADAWQ